MFYGIQRYENETEWEFCWRCICAKIESTICCDWQDIVEEFDLGIHRDSLRKAVNVGEFSAYKVAKYYEAKLKEMASNGNIDDNEYLQALENALHKLEQKEIDVKKETVKLNDARRQYQQYIRTEARWEDIVDMFQREIQALPDNRLFLKCNESRDHKLTFNEASLLLSDWHVGMSIDSPTNTYNLDVLQRRVEQLLNKTIDAIKLHDIDRIHVELLGDFIHGIIHLNGRLHQNENVVRQCIIVADLLSTFLMTLAEYCEVYVYNACGNHSRVSANVKESIKEENFELMIWELIKREVNKFDVGVVCIDNEINCETILYTLENGKVVCGVHGHHESKKVTPDTIFRLERVLGRHIDEVHEGHFHNPQYLYDVIINGTLGGSDEYAQDLPMHYANKPSQTMVVHFNDGTICTKVLVVD